MSATVCTASGAGIAHALASVDCRIGEAVASSYGRLFGPSGAFAAVLTVLLTLYVGVIGLGLITGRSRLTLAGMTPRVAAIGLVLTFATSWPAYQTMVYGLLVGGPEQIAATLNGGHADLSLAVRLDALFDRFAEAARALGDGGKPASGPLGPLAGPQMAAALVWVSGLVILLGAAGTLVLTRIMLAILLALGPVFVAAALFRQTRGLFEGWLRTAVMFALAPLLTVLAGSLALSLLAPLVDAIADDPQAAATDLRPVLELFLGSMAYAGLMVLLLWTCARLVNGWRLGRGERAEDQGRAGPDAAPLSAPPPPAALRMTTPTDPRVSSVVAHLSQPEPAAAMVRVEQAVAARPPGAAPALAAAGSSPRRIDGLGQAFRARTSSTPLSGAAGA